MSTQSRTFDYRLYLLSKVLPFHGKMFIKPNNLMHVRKHGWSRGISTGHYYVWANENRGIFQPAYKVHSGRTPDLRGGMLVFPGV